MRAEPGDSNLAGPRIIPFPPPLTDRLRLLSMKSDGTFSKHAIAADTTVHKSVQLGELKVNQGHRMKTKGRCTVYGTFDMFAVVPSQGTSVPKYDVFFCPEPGDCVSSDDRFVEDASNVEFWSLSKGTCQQWDANKHNNEKGKDWPAKDAFCIEFMVGDKWVNTRDLKFDKETGMKYIEMDADDGAQAFPFPPQVRLPVSFRAGGLQRKPFSAGREPTKAGA
jgi:hypothetical protein